MRGWRSAFTLIELVVVMAIMVIMGALAPMITSGVVLERQTYNVAAQLQQDLLLVQNESVTYSADPAAHPSDAAARLFEIYFDASNRRYFVESKADAVFNSPTDMSGKVLTRQLSSSMKLSLDSTLTATPHISFDNQGNPYPSSGVITVSNTSGTKILTITVSVIGRVTVDWVKK